MRLTFDMWLPAPLAPLLFNGSREIDDRGSREYAMLGRLAPGASSCSAHNRSWTRRMRELAVAFPQTNTGMRAEMLSFWEAPRGPQRLLAASLAILQAITLLLLLAVCGNTANLVLARASARRQEMAVRLALGAKPWHVGRLLLTESVLLALCGAAARRSARALGNECAQRRAADAGPRHSDLASRPTSMGQVSRSPSCSASAAGASSVWRLRCSSSRVDPQQLRAGVEHASRAAGCATC